jgi:hypothetical protein
MILMDPESFEQVSTDQPAIEEGEIVPTIPSAADTRLKGWCGGVQMELPSKLAEGCRKWICETTPVHVDIIDGAIVGVRVPDQVEYTVTEADPKIKCVLWEGGREGLFPTARCNGVGWVYIAPTHLLYLLGSAGVTDALAAGRGPQVGEGGRQWAEERHVGVWGVCASAAVHREGRRGAGEHGRRRVPQAHLQGRLSFESNSLNRLSDSSRSAGCGVG